MIGWNGKEIRNISFIDGQGVIHVIARISKGVTLVWQMITKLKSCFANGYWDGKEPWTGNNAWNQLKK